MLVAVAQIASRTDPMEVLKVVSNIAIDVRYYDDQEKQKLLTYPTSRRIEDLVQSGLSVPVAQFLTYYLFDKKRPGKRGYRNYDEIAQRTHRALADMEDWITLAGASANRVPDDGFAVSSITERIGESVALSVVNALHGLHEIDWNKIPTHRGRRGFPTFDYETPLPQSASDGISIVQVEAKGTAVADTSVVAPSVRTQATKARKKKAEVADLEAKGTYRYPANVRYGTVTAVGIKGDLRCYLLDPPADATGSPVVVKVLNRLRSLTELLTFLMPRSALAAAAQTRLWAAAELENPFELSGVPLIKGTGAPFAFIPFDGRNHTFFRNMSHVVDGPAGGIVTQVRNGELVFIGIREDLASMLIEQDFKRIASYAFPSASLNKRVECVFSPSRVRRLAIPPSVPRPPRDRYWRVTVSGLLHYSAGGMVFGTLRFV